MHSHTPSKASGENQDFDFQTKECMSWATPRLTIYVTNCSQALFSTCIMHHCFVPQNPSLTQLWGAGHSFSRPIQMLQVFHLCRFFCIIYLMTIPFWLFPESQTVNIVLLWVDINISPVQRWKLRQRHLPACAYIEKSMAVTVLHPSKLPDSPTLYSRLQITLWCCQG